MVKSDFKNLIKSSIEDHNKSLAYVQSENFEKKF